MPLVHTKIYLHPGNDIRRIQMNTQDSFQSFVKQLRDMYESAPFYTRATNYDTSVQYLDEESEWVTISTEAEWSFALNTMQASNSQTLKFKCHYLSKENGHEGHHHPHPHHHHHPHHPQHHPHHHHAHHHHHGRHSVNRCHHDGHPRPHTGIPPRNMDVNDRPLFMCHGRRGHRFGFNRAEKKKNMEKETVQEVQPVNIPTVVNDNHLVDEDVSMEENIQTRPEETTVQTEETNVIVMDEPQMDTEEVFEYENQLNSLVAMGFPNVDFNKFLLQKNAGDLTKVVSQLLEL